MQARAMKHESQRRRSTSGRPLHDYLEGSKEVQKKKRRRKKKTIKSIKRKFVRRRGRLNWDEIEEREREL